MPGSFALDIVTPARLVYQGEVTSLQAPDLDGLFGVLHNRAPLLVALGTGQVKFTEQDGETRYAAVTGGFFRVADNHAVILADQAEFAEEIDVAEAERRMAEARAHLQGRLMTEDEMKRHQQALASAATRVKVASQVRRG